MTKDQLAINTIKMAGVKAINIANSGHPGIVLGSATISHTLFTRHLKFDPKNPKWINRDRFILSAGHGSALLYSQLRLLNLISTENLKNFRQYKSITPGHPEYGMTPGVEATTGPLGQGIAMSVGIALSETSLAARYKEIDHYTYALCGDGDIQEGVAMEAMSFAGQNKLEKLIILHDSNDIQLDSPVSVVFSENIKKKMEAMNWDYQKVGNTIKEIDEAITKAKKSKKPSYIEVKTIIGEGSSKEGTSAVHGAPLGDDIKILKKNLNWKGDEFVVKKEVKELYQKTIFKKGAAAFKKFKPSKGLQNFLTSEGIELKMELPKDIATRASSGEVIKELNNKLENWIGGSADLTGSTKAIGGDGEYSPKNRKGRNIMFGVREFAMHSMANGMALHSNFKPFVSTFFVFSDYAKPSTRLAALMKLPVTYIYTHDSVFVGEDGPTHEPIEHLAMLRSIPNLNVVRPADEKEVLGAYELAINAQDTPTAIVLTRQNIVSLKETSQAKTKKGNYKLVSSKSKWTLVASGSELANAVAIGKELKLNVVSISNFNGKVNWDTTKAITIEAASTYGLARWGLHNIGIDSFGESAPGETAYKHFKLDKANLRKRIQAIIKKG